MQNPGGLSALCRAWCTDGTQVNAEQASWDIEMYLIMVEWADSFSSRRVSNSTRLSSRKT